MMLRFAFVSLLLAGTASAQAQGNLVERFQQGVNYDLIDNPQPTSAPTGKVEVMEVFSYACPACAMFQPAVNKWRQSMPADATFVALAAAWNPTWELYSRAYYASDALGIKSKTHDAFFRALHVERLPLVTAQEIADWYAKTAGIEAADFLATMNSTGVNAKVFRAKQQVPRMGVSGTPTMVVGGRYRVNNQNASSQDEIFEVVNFLVAREVASRGAPGQ